VNPFQAVPLYSEEVRKNYFRGTRDEKPPHLYHLAFDGYENMLRTKTSQSFVISGESGAGKSESTKHIVNHVIELCKAGKKSLEQRIQDLNPLLEAFGNAKTVMNNNSSRFGKFIEIKFTTTGAVMGAELSEYLLEKSRVARQSEGELNYHVFYYLLAGLPQCSLFSYDLGPASAHNYLRSPGGPTDAEVACPDNVASFNELVSTLSKMGFEDEDVASMLKILSAIILVGDTTFEEGANDAAVITSDLAKLQEAAALLQCDFAQLQASMLSFTSLVGRDRITRTYTAATALGNRDAFATAFYARMFGWIVTCCNTLLIDPGQ
jgi:myosin-3